jgi:archaellum component FlaG (FlaF/FlaG flagellin family)
MKASTTILKGTIVVLDSTGYAKGPSAATTLITAGRAAETVDNSAGASGDLKIRVEPGQFRYNNSASTDAIGVTEVGKDCYLVDNQTVAKTDASGTRSRAGKVMDVDTDGVWVLLGLGL